MPTIPNWPGSYLTVELAHLRVHSFTRDRVTTLGMSLLRFWVVLATPIDLPLGGGGNTLQPLAKVGIWPVLAPKLQPSTWWGWPTYNRRGDTPGVECGTAPRQPADSSWQSTEWDTSGHFQEDFQEALSTIICPEFDLYRLQRPLRRGWKIVQATAAPPAGVEDWPLNQKRSKIAANTEMVIL